MNTTHNNYDEYFDDIAKRLESQDAAIRKLALEQALVHLSAGETDTDLRQQAAETLAEWLYAVQVKHAGRGLEWYADEATRINTFKQYPPVLWTTDAGLYLCGAVEQFLSALDEHRAEVAAAHQPRRLSASDLYFAHMGE